MQECLDRLACRARDLFIARNPSAQQRGKMNLPPDKSQELLGSQKRILDRCWPAGPVLFFKIPRQKPQNAICRSMQKPLAQLRQMRHFRADGAEQGKAVRETIVCR